MAFVGKWFGFGRNEHYDRGVRAFDSGLFEEAIHCFNECLAESRDRSTIRLATFYKAESYSNLGQSALKGENYVQAVDYLRRAIELHPHFPDLRYLLALAYAGTGDRGLQHQAVERALELNPKYAAAILLQATMFYEDGDEAQAMKLAAQAVEIEPSLNNERYQFALSSHAAGDKERTLTTLRSLRGNDSADANAHMRVADNYAKAGQWSEAAQEYRFALEIAPRYADIRCKYGQTLLQMDQCDLALEQFDLALDVNEKYADAHAYRGVALRRLDREIEARDAFRSALEFNPEHLIASQELSRLRA